MSYTVIIPSKNAYNLAKCVDAIRQKDNVERIIVIDDGLAYYPLDVEVIPGVEPFCFARNVNLGIRAAGDSDCLLLNDDALLETNGGFTAMSQMSYGWGILAPRTNVSGNPNQTRKHVEDVWEEPKRCLPFLCVYIPRSTFEAVGLLDEQFVGYGGEDSDFCHRARLARLRLGIFSGCYVDHASLTPTFRKASNCAGDTAIADKIMREKWGVRA